MAENSRYVDETIVSCDGCGSNANTGHPLIYLNLGDEGKIECPYCSCVFILNK